MNQKRLMVFGGSILQVPTIKQAKKMGLYVIVVDIDPNCIGFKYADKCLLEDYVYPEIAIKIAKENHIDGLIHPCSELGAISMGVVNETLNLPGINYSIALNSTNKNKMRNCFELHQAPSPMSFKVENPDQLEYYLDKINGSGIIKPARNSGSRGVSLITKHDDNLKKFEAYDYALKNCRDKMVLCEEYIEGEEYSVEAIVFNKNIQIVAITQKITSNAPFFVEIGHFQPANLTVSTKELIKEASIKGINALNLDWCAAHVELKVSNDEVFLIEIGARLGGDFITSHLVPYSTGINIVECAIKLALGEIPNINNYKPLNNGVAIGYIIPNKGIVQAVNIIENLNVDSIIEFNINLKEGDEIELLNSSNKRYGYVITKAMTGIDAYSLALEYISKILIILKNEKS
jgi:biotin carboxylase